MITRSIDKAREAYKLRDPEESSAAYSDRKTAAEEQHTQEQHRGIKSLVFGGAAAIFAVNRLPFFGLLERLNIGTLMIWQFLISLRTVKRGARRLDP